jgi:CrcB protein
MPGLTIALLAVGATLGATLRYYLSVWAALQLSPDFPYGTLLVNLAGSVLLGAFMALVISEHWAISPQVRLLVATGFCGSLTTFSTYSYETVLLLQNGRYLAAVGYSLGSLLLGLLGVLLGIGLARLAGA